MTFEEIVQVAGEQNNARGNIVRVELHSAAGDGEYDALHAKMKEAGFRRYVSSGGVFYKLPRGSYHHSQPAVLSKNVALRAGRIAEAIRPNPSIIVTLYDASALRLDPISEIEAGKL